jgi:glycosyltransferase involved in cell wall biosynthesis
VARQDTDPLDITHLTTPASVGGLESVVATLAAGIRRRGHRVRVLAVTGVGESERCRSFAGLPDAGVELVELRLPPRRYRAEWRRVTEELRRAASTVAHTHGYRADVVGLLAARAARRPTVSTVHGYVASDLRGRVYEWVDRRALRRFDAVVAVSRPLVERLARAGVPAPKLELVPNAPGAEQPTASRDEARRVLGLDPSTPVVGWIGRLTPEKGPDVLVEAAALLPGDVGISVLGEGPLKAGLLRRAESLGLGRRVRWHGIVESAGRLLAAFDVVVLSSRTEGTPMVLLEAMAAGVPIVATAVGGVPDVVSDREAVLVPPDDPRALAAAIASALDRRGGSASRVEAARTRLRSAYGVEAWLDRYEAIYRRVACR